MKTIELKDFVRENKDLLSSASIFSALTLFSSQLLDTLFGKILSLLFLSGFVLLWLELWTTFPKENGSRRLSLFENVISLSAISIIIFWFFEIMKVSFFAFIMVLSTVFSVFIINFLSELIKKYDVFNKIFKTKNNEKKGVRFIFGIVLLMIVWYVCSLITSNIVSFIITKYNISPLLILFYTMKL